MKLIIRTGLLAIALSLSGLAACGGSDDEAAGGSSTGGTGGTAAGGAAGSSTGGMGGTTAGGAAGSSTGATGGTAAGGTGGTTSGGTSIKAAVGGTVTADGLVIEIPPGALAVDTDITVVVSDGATLPGAATLVAKAYDLGPDGTKFSKPVKLTIDFDAVKLGTKSAVVSYLDTGKWVALSDSASAGTKVSATTTHFTPFGVVGAEAATCLAMAKTECQSCCKTTYAKGAGEPIQNAFKFCACTTGAPCETQCASSVCASLAPTAECQTCLQAAGSAVPKSACYTQVEAACVASTDCMNYLTCSSSCK